MPLINYRELKKYLADLHGKSPKGKACQAYLIYGEELLYKKALESLLTTLLTAKERGFNYEAIEGANDKIDEALQRINTYSMIPSPKVVALCDSRIFYTKQDAASIMTRVKEAFDNNKLKKAATNFISLLSLLKLSFEDIEQKKNKLELGLDSAINNDWVEELVEYCHENSIKIPAVRDQSSILQTAVESGFPAGHYLILTTDLVDKRRVLFKAFKEKGMIIDCAVPKGNRRDDQIAQTAVMNDTLQEILAEYDKTMDRTTFQAVRELTGFDLRTFNNNLIKLAEYVGERRAITTADVEAVLKRTAQDPIYEFTNALADKNQTKTLFLLNSLLDDKFYPLQILGAMVNLIRRLLVIKDFSVSDYGREVSLNSTYDSFKRYTMPAVKSYDEQLTRWQKEWVNISGSSAANPSKTKSPKKFKLSTDLMIAKNPNNPYPVFQTMKKAMKFTREQLLGFLGILAKADLSLKSSGQDQKLVLEKTILTICRNQ